MAATYGKSLSLNQEQETLLQKLISEGKAKGVKDIFVAGLEAKNK